MSTDYRQMLDINVESLREIPDEALSEDLIFYALSKYEKALLYISDARITEEMCKYSFGEFKNSFKYIPARYKSYDMCLDAVLWNAKFIKSMPLEFVTREFLGDLKLRGGYISSVDINYVEMCLKSHDKMQSENLLDEADDLSNQQYKLEKSSLMQESFANASLTEYPELFSNAVLKRMESMGVTTIGDLLLNVNNPMFMVRFMDKKTYYREVDAAVRLLRCKFLGEDPLIDENDFSLSVDNIFEKLGINPRFAYGCSVEQFWESIRKGDYSFLKKIRGVGDSVINSIIYKLQIVIDYHNKHPKISAVDNGEFQTNDPTLEDLMAEYSRLMLESQRLNCQINQLLAAIQAKNKDQSRGSITNG